MLDRIGMAGPEGAATLDRATGGRAAMPVDEATGRVRSIVRDWSGAFPAAFGGRTAVVTLRGLPR